MLLKNYEQKDYDRGRSSLVILLWWIIQGTIFRYSLHNMYGFRAGILRLFGAEIGKSTKIRANAKFTYPWKVSIGDYSWIGDEVQFYSLDTIQIGSNVVISQKSYLCTGSHDISSTNFSLMTNPIVVEDGSWIAADCFIHPGVVVAQGSVIAARSTVLKSTEANFIYAGNPARKIKNKEKNNEKNSICN